jgi:hypothetical protein
MPNELRPAGAAHLLFLSHAGVDSEAALALAQRLEESPEAQAHGLKVWIDKADLGAGGRWKDALQSALASCTAFAVYVGSHGVVNWVWDEVSVALDRAHKDCGYPLVPVLAAGTTSADLPSFLSQYQGVGDPNHPDEFRKLVRAVLRLEPRAKVALELEPFVGLHAYTTNKTHLFFGREKETDELVSLLREMPLVLVTGDSGSGKSSLVLAGLVPAFRGGRLGGSPDEGPDQTIWHVVETRPGTDPFGRLADDVRDAAERTGSNPTKASELAELVRTRQPDKVRDAVLSGAPKDPGRPTKVLVISDQFEEFRTSPQAAAYVAALLRLATPGDDRVRVVLTMRRDYLYACASFPDLRERLQGGKPSGRYLLRRMSREGLNAIITKPLDLAGIDERDREDLARMVLKDVGDEPGELALLQMALWRTWSEARRRGPDLVRAYGRIGRVEGALAQAADSVFDRLSPDEQRRGEALFVRLVRPGEAGGATRRVARLDEFDAPTRALAEKLSQREQWRLLTVYEETVEIAHEQLATQWLRYQHWIANLSGDPEHGIPADPRGDDLRLLQSLIADAARWEAALAEDKARYHATGVGLELYRQVAGRRDAWLSEVERRFVAASVDADQREKKRREDERAERERLLRERQAQAVRLAENERQRAAEQSAAAAKARYQAQQAIRTERGLNLSQRGWGAIFVQDSQSDVPVLLQKLLEHRRNGAGPRYLELTYRPGETAQELLARYGAGLGGLDPIPYYLLIVGSPEQIPYSVQYELASNHAVGRIFFERPEQYSAYADNVVNAETDAYSMPATALLFGPTHVGDAATKLTAGSLLKPIAKSFEEERPKWTDFDWTLTEVIGESATKSKLSNILSSGKPPALLFLSGHGMMYRRDHPAQEDMNGAILCAGWPGFGSITGEVVFSASDVSAEIDLKGTIVLANFCFGAGTPRYDDFSMSFIQNKPLPELASRELMSKLPMQLLGVPSRGALAFIGHVDRCWGFSISGIDSPNSPNRPPPPPGLFSQVFGQLMNGYTIGFAMDGFRRRFALNATLLISKLAQSPIDERKLVSAKLATFDVRNYVIIGDPAVSSPARRDELR